MRCPIVFKGHPSNFKGTQDKNTPILTRIEHFRTVTQVWLHRWIWNDAQVWHSIKEVPYCFSRSSINFQDHTGQKNHQFWPELSVSGLLTPVWIYQWLWNDAQSLKQHRRGALLFFKVIHQFSRSRVPKNRQFWPELNVSRLLLQFEFTNGFEMMHKSWCSIEEMPHCFPRSFIKLQGHAGWLIDDLNPIWVRLLGRSQLSNPSDLPCFWLIAFIMFMSWFRFDKKLALLWFHSSWLNRHNFLHMPWQNCCHAMCKIL